MYAEDVDFDLKEQYKVVIDLQLQEVDRGQRKIQSLFSEYIETVADHTTSLNSILKKVNNIFIYQLMCSKGLVSDIQQKQQELAQKDLNKIIQDVNNLIKKYIEFETTIEAIIKSEIGNKFSQFEITISVISATIENLYAALRDLKKANKKAPIGTSDLAKDAASRSSKALAKVINHH